MKPKGLYATFIVMCLMNLAGLGFVNLQAGSVPGQFVFMGLIIAVSYVVLWHYWRGKNWARILVIIASVVALINLLFLPMFSVAQRLDDCSPAKARSIRLNVRAEELPRLE